MEIFLKLISKISNSDIFKMLIFHKKRNDNKINKQIEMYIFLMIIRFYKQINAES